jgi:molybdopterin-binding protein
VLEKQKRTVICDVVIEVSPTIIVASVMALDYEKELNSKIGEDIALLMKTANVVPGKE